MPLVRQPKTAGNKPNYSSCEGVKQLSPSGWPENKVTTTSGSSSSNEFADSTD